MYKFKRSVVDRDSHVLLKKYQAGSNSSNLVLESKQLIYGRRHENNISNNTSKKKLQSLFNNIVVHSMHLVIYDYIYCLIGCQQNANFPKF